MKYSLSKYRYASKAHPDGQKDIIAISTYAGKSVRGVAKCRPEDNFDESFGKKLAAARCNLKISKKRMKRAERQLEAANRELMAAKQRCNDMLQYLTDATDDYNEAKNFLADCMNELGE